MPNGAGKTTLFRMIVGQETPDAGSITIGDTVQLSYVDQSRDDLAADKSVFDEIAQGDEFIKVGAARAARPAPTCRASTSAARTSRSPSASCPAASGTGSTWPSC